MADEIDFSQWTQGSSSHRSPEAIRARNPLVPGGEAPVPQVEQVRLDSFVPIDATPVEVLAREGQEAAARRIQGDAVTYTRLMSLLALGPRREAAKPTQDRAGRDVAIRVAEILDGSPDRYTRAAGNALLASTLRNSDLIVAIDDLESDPEDEDMSGKSTKQGDRLFRTKVTENTKVAHVFWAVANNHRELDQFEANNVAMKAVEAGYMVEAKTKAGFKLTASGEAYYRKAIAKNLPADFASEKPLMTSTYYHSFPNEPRANSNIIHVFWVVANDFRKLSERERRNVVYPAIAAGLIEKAPEDDMGFPRRADGQLCRCRFILTEDGKRYYEQHVKPVIPEGFESREPPAKVSRQSDAPTSALKAT